MTDHCGKKKLRKYLLWWKIFSVRIFFCRKLLAGKKFGQTFFQAEEIFRQIFFWLGYRFTGYRFIVCRKFLLCTLYADNNFKYFRYSVKKLLLYKKQEKQWEQKVLRMMLDVMKLQYVQDTLEVVGAKMVVARSRSVITHLKDPGDTPKDSVSSFCYFFNFKGPREKFGIKASNV